MLSPDSRAVAMEVLKSPPGYRLEQAVLTTYSLDLDVLLALPLAVLAHAENALEDLLKDPLLLLEALREAGNRFDVFVDQTGIGIPRVNRALYSLLETSVHPVRAPHGGVFHPKIWVARFSAEGRNDLLRVTVASRNLTHDRSWDVALTTEADAGSTEAPVDESADLATLLQHLPKICMAAMTRSRAQAITQLAEDVARTRFPVPDGFGGKVRFEVLGLKPALDEPWRPARADGDLMVISPFLTASALNGLAASASGSKTLISRREALDELPASCLESWDEIRVLLEAALGEAEDEGVGQRVSDLHAKLVGVEHRGQARWYLGSANITHAALAGRNVECLAMLKGPAGPTGHRKGVGLEIFRQSGFMTLCELYQPRMRSAEDANLRQARRCLEEAARSLAAAALTITCEPSGDLWKWRLEGAMVLPEGVGLNLWPVSLAEENARSLHLPAEWKLPLSRLTAFVACRLSVDEAVEDVRLVLKLPAIGMPDDRTAQILRTLIDSPERLMQFLRALLGGIDNMASDFLSGDGRGWGAASATPLLNTETLLEDLVRAASRDPSRLAPVRRLIDDLRQTPEGRQLLPDDLIEIWDVINEALTAESNALAPSGCS